MPFKDLYDKSPDDFKPEKVERTGLTRRQLDLFRFIEKHIEMHLVSPSFDEMRDGLGLSSKSGVHRLVTALVDRGYIARDNYRARSIYIPDKSISTVRALEAVLSRCDLRRKTAEELSHILACERGVAKR